MQSGLFSMPPFQPTVTSGENTPSLARGTLSKEDFAEISRSDRGVDHPIPRHFQRHLHHSPLHPE